MKQLPMTPELTALIHKAVGPDVDATKLAVFETIALNDKPLPGKKGSIFEGAVIAPITMLQMVDSINAGNHIPLISDHDLAGEPKGRFFHAGLDYGDDGEVEMRALFYLDETEAVTIAKLNAGSLDEVSVAFLSTQFLCSECHWDYFEFGTSENITIRTCANDHTIGTDGVHADMIGLNTFVELSLVARGAADKPKIIGKSESRLAPEVSYRLAAHGIVPDALVVRASLGIKEETKMETAQLMTDLVESKTKVALLTASEAGEKAKAVELTTKLSAAEATILQLTTELTASKAETKVPADYEPLKASAAAAVSFLQAQLNHLTVASGKPQIADAELPTDVAKLKADIETLTGNLTSILPVGGRSAGAASGEDVKLAFNPAAFTTRA
jgi:hypothetical protein